MGDPVEIKVRGYTVTQARSEQIFVKLPDAK
jgi:hypothetical protein